MGKRKKQTTEPPRRQTAREWLGQQTNTNPEAWEEIPSGTYMYDRGYRYRNRETNQWAKRPTHEQ